MSFVKKRWLVLTALVAMLCVSLGTIMVIRASAPVESKTVYLLPKPNPERAEILARALQPRRHAYATRASDEAHAQDTRKESSESSGSESLSHDAEFDDAELESYLLGLEHETVEEKRDFPPVPEGFPFTPVWLRRPGYKKGDMPNHELIYRVLIKLWNQGDRGFQDGIFSNADGKVYPIYPDVLYVQWDDTEVTDEWGNSRNVRYIASSAGTHTRDFELEDFITGEWRTKYPDTKIVAFDDSGYDPYTFLTEND